MINKLKKLKEMILTDTEVSILKCVDELIELEQERIRKQIAKGSKCLKSYNACMKVLKSKVAKNRPVLQKAKQFKDGSVAFTDSYQLYWLKDNRYNLPVHDEQTTYPNVEHMIPKTYLGEEIELPTLDEVNYAIKDKSFLQVGECCVDPKFLLNAYSILGEKLTGYYYGVNRPIKLINKDDEIGVILPIRKEVKDA